MQKEKIESVFVVTRTEDYMLENQWVFACKDDADRKYEEVINQMFSEQAEEHGMSPSEYQDSIEWWDDDCRTKVHFEEVVLEHGGCHGDEEKVEEKQ